MSELPLPEHDAASIVLVGAFNPRIYHPAWFVRNDLLPPGSEESASVEIVNNDLCAFETDWFRLEVLSDRFVLRTMASPSVEALRDLVLGALRILRHTPVHKIGLNTHAHWRLPTEQSWHDFGHLLAPKDALWEPVLKRPGTFSLSVQGMRPDDRDGHIRIRVEPSSTVEHGIFLETNDEVRELSADSAAWVEDVLTSEWDASRTRAADIRRHVLSFAFGREG